MQRLHLAMTAAPRILTGPSLLMAAFTAVLTAGCAAVGPDYETPVTQVDTQETIGSDPAVESLVEEPAHDWWRTLEDPKLDALVGRALAENRDVRQAAANVEAARRLLRLEKSNLRPQGELNAAYERRRLAGAAFGQDDLSFPDSNFFTIGGAMSWELDFFGRVRRGVEAALADAQAAEALRRDAQVLVVAEVVTAYTDYRGALLQLDVARQNLRVQEDTVALTQTRFDEGYGSLLDLRRAQAQAKLTEASIPPLEASATAAANRLATLTAQPVAELIATLKSDAELPAPPATLAVGDPSTLIQRRADVRAAERELAAATARIGIAKADYLPRISLTGFLGAASQSLSGITEQPAFNYSIGPSITWAGFDIPRVKAQVEAEGARAEAALAAYEQAVLIAIEETQASLAGFGRERVRYAALLESTEKNREAAALARIRFDEGVDDFIDVLDAQGRLLEAEASLAQSVTAVTRRYADVYRALGAGWTP
jgi:multidrug efflux system outer membrane protein